MIRKKTIFRLRHETLGGHTHVRVFAGTGPTLGLCGTLTFRNEEWEDLASLLSLEENVQIVPEDRPD